MDTHPRLLAKKCTPRGWASSRSECSHLGQSIGQDDGKRGPRGYDAGKKIKGRKRHILVDTLGLILEVHVQAANIQDPAGAKEFLLRLKTKHWRLKKIWADASYRGQLIEWIHNLRQGHGHRRIELEIVAKSETGKFVVLPKRWIVERTFGWLGRSRRLSKDYEALCDTTETWILLAMIYLMVKRLALRH